MTIQEAKKLYDETRLSILNKENVALDIFVRETDKSIEQIIRNGHGSYVIGAESIAKSSVPLDRIKAYYEAQGYRVIIETYGRSSSPDLYLSGWAK